MFSLRNRAGKRLREPFGKAGLTVAVIALVFAMVGGAFAAAGLNGKQKKEVKSIAKGFQGTGPAGAPGPAGPAGAKGDTGAKGDKGDAGNAGTAGAEGKSVTGTPIAAGGACGEGITGVKYTLNGTPTNICNGEPGPLLETLPKGETLTGQWSILTNSAGKGTTSFGYQFPLASEAQPHRIQAGQEGIEEAANCPGTAQEPEAAEGILCVYTTLEIDEAFEPAELGTAQFAGSSRYGFSMTFFGGGKPGATGIGTWAVTGN